MTEAKYKVGQIVVLTVGKKVLPFRIMNIKYENGIWFYQWNKNNYASESMIRGLTPEEKG